jgi:pentatricopeptide repeat protein
MSGPLLEKYQKALAQNPKSRVFAPLAETYRKLGMTEKALEVLKQGIRNHPNYPMGHLGLAACYADLSQWSLVYNTLKPLVEKCRDNLRIQSLYAQSCEKQGEEREALDTYKFLLFLNPKNEQAASKVAELETRLESTKSKITKEDPKVDNEQLDLFAVDEINLLSEAEQWTQVDWQKGEESKLPEETPQESIEEWIVGQPQDKLDNPKEEVAKDTEPKPAQEQPAPFVTHTLVDLYCSQGHPDKALEVLNKIVELNPDDERTHEKIKEVESLIEESLVLPVEPEDEQEEEEATEVIFEEIPDEAEIESETLENLISPELPSLNSEETPIVDLPEAHEQEDLMSLYDQKMIGLRADFLEKVESRYWNFHKKLKQRSQEVIG